MLHVRRRRSICAARPEEAELPALPRDPDVFEPDPSEPPDCELPDPEPLLRLARAVCAERETPFAMGTALAEDPGICQLQK